MDKREAKGILNDVLAQYRRQRYTDLKRLLATQDCQDIVGSSGTTYQLEIQAFWDDRPDGNLRVRAAIDDGGWRAFSPLTDDFILAPDGSFIEE